MKPVTEVMTTMTLKVRTRRSNEDFEGVVVELEEEVEDDCCVTGSSIIGRLDNSHTTIFDQNPTLTISRIQQMLFLMEKANLKISWRDSSNVFICD